MMQYTTPGTVRARNKVDNTNVINSLYCRVINDYIRAKVCGDRVRMYAAEKAANILSEQLNK